MKNNVRSGHAEEKRESLERALFFAGSFPVYLKKLDFMGKETYKKTGERCFSVSARRPAAPCGGFFRAYFRPPGAPLEIPARIK
jgi:hypothetical protein